MGTINLEISLHVQVSFLGTFKFKLPVMRLVIMGVIVLLSLSSLRLASASLETTYAERRALAILFNATGGATWGDKTNWNAGDPCTRNDWYGVSCDTATDPATIRYAFMPTSNLSHCLSLPVASWTDSCASAGKISSAFSWVFLRRCYPGLFKFLALYIPLHTVPVPGMTMTVAPRQ